MTLFIQLLGDVEIRRDTTSVSLPGYRPLALLSYLLLSKKAHSRDHLVDLLFDWPADPKASLRWTLTKLRRGIGAHYILADRHRVGFNFDADYWCDVEALAAGDLAVYRGELLENLHLRHAPVFEEWLVYTQQQWRHRYQNGLIKQLEAAEIRHDFAMAAQAAHQLIALDSLREEWHRALMRAYALSGQHDAALAQYELCHQLLCDELGMAPSPKIEELYATIAVGKALQVDADNGGQHEPLAHSSTTSANHRQRTPNSALPTQLTTFVGRSAELHSVEETLTNIGCRLLTLVGPGGIGKSRLAMQIAECPPSLFTHGAYFVPLAALDSIYELVPAIAKSLGFSFYRDQDQRQRLFAYLRRKSLLLVLDNFEHLLTAPDWDGGEMLLELLTSASYIKLLITSRARLQLPSEWLYEVIGLATPTLPENTQFSHDVLMSHDAVQLFVQRASQVNPRYAPANVGVLELRQIVAICSSVAGMPLAIELLAAWTRYMSCAEIAASLSESLEILTSPIGGADPRHASMRSVFAHSWRLLNSLERCLLAQLAVFRGGFTRQAAARVTGASLLELSALLDKSLLSLSTDGRYGFHPLVQRYAAEQLTQTQELESQMRNAHSHYYCQLLAECGEGLKGAKQAQMAQSIAIEIDNIRDAWRWAASRDQWNHLAEAIFGLGYFYFQQGRFKEGKRHFETLLRRLQSEPVSSLRALVHARALYWLGHYVAEEEASSYWTQIWARLTKAEEGGYDTERDKVATLYGLGITRSNHHQLEQAVESFERSLAISQTIGDEWSRAQTLAAYARHLCFQTGDLAKAWRLASQALVLQQTLGELTGTVNTLDVLCVIATFLRKYEDAMHLSQQSLAICHQLANAYQTGVAHRTASWALLLAGRVDECLAHLQESLVIFEELGADDERYSVFMGLGWRNCLMQRYSVATGHATWILDQPPGHVPLESQGEALYTLAQAAFGLGDYCQSRRRAQQSLELLRDHGTLNQQAIARYALATAELALGHIDQTLYICYELLQIGSLATLYVLSLGALLQGKDAETGAEAERGFEIIGLQHVQLPMLATPYYLECITRLLPEPMKNVCESRRQAAMKRGRALDLEQVTAALRSYILTVRSQRPLKKSKIIPCTISSTGA